MEKIYYSDLANIPSDVCIASLDEDLKPIGDETSHKWDDENTCSECGTTKDA